MHTIFESLRGRKAGLLDGEKAVKSAVILPLVEEEKGLSVLFEIRSHSLKGQPGEICFPGGHLEEGESPQEAALRETSEELGIYRNQIEIICPLDILFTPFQIMIYPYLGYIEKNAQFRPAFDEVAEIFCVPLDYLKKAKPIISRAGVKVTPPENFPYHLIEKGKNYSWRSGSYPVFFYVYENRIIWGLTARILHHFIKLIGR